MTATVERPAPDQPGAGRYRLQLGDGLIAHTDWDLRDGTTTITIRHRPDDGDDNRPF